MKTAAEIKEMMSKESTIKSIAHKIAEYVGSLAEADPDKGELEIRLDTLVRSPADGLDLGISQESYSVKCRAAANRVVTMLHNADYQARIPDSDYLCLIVKWDK